MVDLKHPCQSDELLDEVFQVLSDASRRKIIELLREAGELKVGTIAEAFDMSLNGVSKHLKVLEEAGMVIRRVEGRSHFISVNWPSLQAPYEWLHFYHHFWQRRLDALVDYVKREHFPSTPALGSSSNGDLPSPQAHHGRTMPSKEKAKKK